MARHRHHPTDRDALQGAAAKRLRQGGQQWTPMRAAVFAALAGEERPASAYDLADRLSAELGKRVAPNSVYRILDLFVDHDLVRRVESANAFVANAHPGCVHDCIFLICDGCGGMTHLDDDRVTGDVRAAAAATGFVPTRPVIEVRGRCGDCR